MERTCGRMTRAHRVSLSVLLEGKLTENENTVVACQDLAVGSGPRGSIAAHLGARSRVCLGAWEPEREALALRPREPRSAHPKPTTGEQWFWGAPSAPPPLQSPLTLTSLASSVTSSCCHRGPTALRSQSQRMGGGASTPNAHAQGQSPRKKEAGLASLPLASDS